MNLTKSKFIYFLARLTLVMGLTPIFYNLSLAQSCNICADIVATDLVGCYRLNNNVTDGSGNNNNGIASSVTYGSDRFSRPAMAGSFNGTSSSVSIPTIPYIGLNTYTYSLWVKLSSLPTSGNLYSLLSIGDGTTADQFISIATNPVSGTNGIGYSSYTSAAIPDRYGNGVSPTVGVWYHIALTRTTTTLKFYINGVLMDTRPTSNPTANYGPSPHNAFIGRRVGGIPQYSNGSLDNVRIYSRDLTLTEIQQLFNEAPELSIFANAGNDTTIIAGDSAQLNASGGTIYSWSPTTGLSNPNIANPKASPAVTTTYSVVITDGPCDATLSVTVNVNLNSAVKEAPGYAKSSITLHPNPASDQISLKGTDDNDSYEIIDILGKVVLTGGLKDGSDISIRLLPQGLYYIRVSSAGDSKVIKFQKQ
jgi:hypothetical protein